MISESEKISGLSQAALLSSREAWLLKELFHFFEELGLVFELAINRSKPDISYLVKVAQSFHHQLADLFAGDLGAGRGGELRCQLINHHFDLFDRHRAFVTRQFDTIEKFVAIKRFPPVV